MRGIIFEDVYVPLYNGLTMDEGGNMAGMSNSLANMAAGNTDFENNFYNGKKEYEKQLANAKEQHPILSVLAQLAGGTLGGVGVAKLIRKGLGVANALKNAKQVYPRRSREQWKADLEYGRQEFNKLREQSPLKREGHPDAYVTKKSWDKIRGGNIPEKYEMLQDVPDIYATGEYDGPTLAEPGHNNGFNQFHWIHKGNKGITVGETENARVLYNVNPNIRQYLLEHPAAVKKLGIDNLK